MKRNLVLLLVVSLSICRIASAAAEVLSQQDVIKLLELKIPEQTITEKVKTSGTAFVLGAVDIARSKRRVNCRDAIVQFYRSRRI